MYSLKLKVEAVNALHRAVEAIWQYEYEHCNTTVNPFKAGLTFKQKYEHPLYEFKPGEIPVSKGHNFSVWYKFEHNYDQSALYLKVTGCLHGGNYKDATSFTMYETRSLEFAEKEPFKLYEPYKLPTFNVKDIEKLGKVAEKLNDGFIAARLAIPYQFREYFKVR